MKKLHGFYIGKQQLVHCCSQIRILVLFFAFIFKNDFRLPKDMTLTIQISTSPQELDNIFVIAFKILNKPCRNWELLTAAKVFGEAENIRVSVNEYTKLVDL